MSIFKGWTKVKSQQPYPDRCDKPRIESLLRTFPLYETGRTAGDTFRHFKYDGSRNNIRSACKLEDAPASSYPGKLTQLLYHRYKTFNGEKDKGLIIFPCELIFLNGHKLKETIYQYIDLWQLGEDFKTWFTECCGVYATLVDRIVPGFPRKEIDSIKEELQYNDNLVVQAEIFHYG